MAQGPKAKSEWTKCVCVCVFVMVCTHRSRKRFSTQLTDTGTLKKSRDGWTTRLRGLWQTQPRDFPLEKAFNELISQQVTVCCVCGMFERPTPFTQWSREQLDERAALLRSRVTTKSLKVVVQRAMICLSETVKTFDDHLIICHQCSIAVHKCKLLSLISVK